MHCIRLTCIQNHLHITLSFSVFKRVTHNIVRYENSQRKKKIAEETNQFPIINNVELHNI